MSFYKNINVTRIISDLKNGIPIFANIKHKVLKTSSKNFYFVKEFIHTDVLNSISNPIFITTNERIAFSKDNIKYNKAEEKIEQDLLVLFKAIEFTPVLIKTNILPKAFQDGQILTITSEEIAEFTQNFIYDVRLASHSPIALKSATHAEFFVFQTLIFGKEHYVIKIGNPEKDTHPLVRIHSSCYTGDLLASLRCDCRDQLQESIKQINEAKNFNGGYIFYLMQEGRGIGLKNKIEAYRLQQEDGLDTVDSNLAIGYMEDERNFNPAVKMMEYFNIKSVVLITNNPKKAKDLNTLGIKVESTMHTVFKPNSYNSDYLDVKKNRMHHSFS